MTTETMTADLADDDFDETPLVTQAARMMARLHREAFAAGKEPDYTEIGAAALAEFSLRPDEIMPAFTEAQRKLHDPLDHDDEDDDRPAFFIAKVQLDAAVQILADGLHAGAIGENEFAAKLNEQFPDGHDPRVAKWLFVRAMEPFLSPCTIAEALRLRPTIRAVVIDPAGLDRLNDDEAA